MTVKSAGKSAKNFNSINEAEAEAEFATYHLIRHGYVSPMKGPNEETYFVEKLKEMLGLERSVEEAKEELILYCCDFNPI